MRQAFLTKGDRPRYVPRVEQLVSGYSLLEGPTVDGQGGVYFSEVLQGGVHRWSPAGVEEVVAKRRGIGGIVLHEDGGLIVTGRTVVHIRDGHTRVLLDVEGVTGFNDLGTASDGSVYVGSLRFMPFKGEEPVPGEIWRIPPHGDAAPVAGGVLWANGIGFSPDGGTAYGSDYARSCVLAWDMTADGSLAAPRVFAEMPAGSADGIAVDSEGGVWVATGEAGTVVRFRADGSLDRRLDVPGPFVSSLCFGGTDMRDVFVTTGDGKLLRGRSPVAGVSLPLARVSVAAAET
jgi:D-xylonolactonase